MKEPKNKGLSDYFTIIIKWRKFIARNVAIVTIIAIIISLVLVTKYTATATILPPNSNQDLMFGFITGLPYSGGTGLSNLARLSGIRSVSPLSISSITLTITPGSFSP